MSPRPCAGVQGRHAPPFRSQIIVQIAPLRIYPLNGVYFIRTRPLFHGLLTLKRRTNIRRLVEPNETMNAIFLRETLGIGSFVFGDTPNEIVRHADTKRSIAATREDVDVIALRHAQKHTPMDPGTRPG